MYLLFTWTEPIFVCDAVTVQWHHCGTDYERMRNASDATGIAHRACTGNPR